MDSLTALRRKRQFGLLATVALLAGLLAYSVLKPDPEEQEMQRLKGIILENNGERDESSMRELRTAMERLSPETRKKLAREIIRSQLYRLRDETKDWTLEQKQVKIDEMIGQVRENFAKLNDEQRATVRAGFQSEEGKTRLRDSLDFYYTEFTAEERGTLDPLVYEVLGNIDAL